jgi:hypothetical protein
VSKDPEQLMWDAVRPTLVSAGLHPCRVENACETGMPDVNYSHGWIELKCLKEWPKRAKTLVAIDHYTKEQRAWAMRRETCGGRVYLLLKVGASHYILLRGRHAAIWVGKMNKEELLKSAIAHWEDGIPNNFAEWLHF